MNKLKYVKAVGGLMLSVVVALPGFAQSLQVGVLQFYPPFSMGARNNAQLGYDIDLINYICSEIKAKCEIKPMTLSKLKSSLKSDDIDMAFSGLTVTPERQKECNFSIPYLESKGRYLSNRNHPHKALEKATIGVQSGSVYEHYLANSKYKKQLVRRNSVSALVQLLGDNKVDYILTDNATATWWGHHSGNSFILSDNAFTVGKGYAVAISKKRSDLISEIDHAIYKFKSSKRARQIAEHYLQH